MAQVIDVRFMIKSLVHVLTFWKLGTWALLFKKVQAVLQAKEINILWEQN